jgi:hypothetical protein
MQDAELVRFLESAQRTGNLFWRLVHRLSQASDYHFGRHQCATIEIDANR